MSLQHVSRMFGRHCFLFSRSVGLGQKAFRQVAFLSNRRQTSTFLRVLSTGRRTCDHAGFMEAWCINEYGSNELLEFQRLPAPTIRQPTEVLVRVHAASVNPIDYEMRSGYGKTLLNIWRKLQGISEFPLILGRDFSGEVVKTGHLARRFKPGDQVWGTPSVINGGTHAEFVLAKQNEISMKPSSWTHTEAASIPYVGCTVWTSLVSRAGLHPHHCQDKRVLVLGGSGGIGTFAVQLLKAWGAHVTTTCSSDAVAMVISLGADHVVDYNGANAQEELKMHGSFDVILDPFGGEIGDQYSDLLSKWTRACFVSLAPPLLSKTDELGVSLGLMYAGQSLTSSAIQKALCSGSSVAWGFFEPNGGALDHIRDLSKSRLIKPVVQEIFPFSKANEAYSALEKGHARGKIVISMVSGEQR